MAQDSETLSGSSVDRSERPGHIGLLLLLAGVLVGAAVGLRFVTAEQAQPLILGLLALLAMAGVFFLFALAIGAVQFAGQGARNDLTKLMADTAGEGLVVADDDGGIVYANENYMALAGGGGARPPRGGGRGAGDRSPCGRERVHRRAGGVRSNLSPRPGRPRASVRDRGDPPVAGL